MEIIHDARHDAEFSRLVYNDLVSEAPRVKQLATQRLYNIMTGKAAPDEATAAAAVKAMAQAIDAALA